MMNNEFENNANDMQFEDMRQQMNTLKKKLQQQEIVNDRIIRQSIKRTASNIKRRYYIIMLLTLLMIPYTYVIFVLNLELSFSFWIGTCMLMLVCGGATYYNCQNVTNTKMMSKNLVEVSHDVARAKKFDANWLYFGIPAVIAWLGWLTWELNQKDAFAARFMIYGIICGAVLGAILGFKMHFKTQSQYQEIIDQIEDLNEDSLELEKF